MGSMDTSVYITNRSLYVVMGTGSKKKVKVKRAYRLPISEGAMMNGIITNDAQLSEELAEYWKTYRFPKKDLKLVIDSGKIMTKIIEVPYLKDEELIRIIGMEFQDAERREQLFDYFPLEKKDPYRMNELFCAAVEKSVLESYLSLFHGLKLKLSSINIGFGCLLKTAFGTGVFKDQTCVLMLMEGDSVSSMLFENGEYIYSRRNRLFNEPGSEARSAELARIISDIQQFQVSRRNEYVIRNIYTSGFDGENIDEFRNQIAFLNFKIEELTSLYGVRFPSTEMTADGEKRTVPGNHLYSIGNLMQ